MSKGTRRLGRGLSSLISSDLSQQEGESPGIRAAPARSLEGMRAPAPMHRLLAIPITAVRRNPTQPRRDFNEESLNLLANSMRDKGTLQPIIVRPAEQGYELVAGERRLRAAKIAGMTEIPAVIRTVGDDELLELALIENIHREDLNPIERARAYRAMHERHGLSHDEIAQRVGEDRATVTNYIRLLGLPEEVIDMVASGDVSVGHAKVLLGVTDPKIHYNMAQRLVGQGWSVRRLETEIARQKRGAPASPETRKVRPAVEDMEQRLIAALGIRVTIREGRRRHAGKLVIHYYCLEDFERIIGLLGVAEEPP